MEFHEISNMFPMMSDDEFQALKTDIEQNGLYESIVLYENSILDGRNRFRACQELGIEPRYVEFEKEDPLTFVISHNLHRRHLSESQRAMVAAKLKPLYEAAAKERQKEAGKTHGRGQEKVVANLPQAKSRDEAAATVNVSPRSVETAATVLKECIPEIIEAVEAGEIAVSDAVNAAGMTEENQLSAIQAVQSGEKKTINSAVNQIENERLKNVPVKPYKKSEYGVIVIDPPWPMEKIERKVAPNQTGSDYPTMELNEIKAMNIPADENCHLFLWTTQKFLPSAFEIITDWSLKYICTFVWHKPGGFQPYGLPQYNCEFVLYCRKGTPKFVDFKSFFTCFSAGRKKHSEKPEEFYETIRRVTAGNRLDMFSRGPIEGFEGWGNESGN